MIEYIKSIRNRVGPEPGLEPEPETIGETF